MITFSREVGEAMPAIIAILFSTCVWFFMKNEHRKVRERYFARYGRYPGETALKQTPAE